MAKLKIGCSIYLAFAGKKVKLPVNPEEIEIKNPTDHKTYDVIGVGEIVVPRKPSLKEGILGILFPGRSPGRVCKRWGKISILLSEIF